MLFVRIGRYCKPAVTYNVSISDIIYIAMLNVEESGELIIIANRKLLCFEILQKEIA
jgi:hypothetical protein